MVTGHGPPRGVHEVRMGAKESPSPCRGQQSGRRPPAPLRQRWERLTPWPRGLLAGWRNVRYSSGMSQHPPARVLADALRLPAHDRLALAAELLDSVEDANDPDWEAAWLAELDRRAEQASSDPSTLEDWASVRDRLLDELRSK